MGETHARITVSKDDTTTRRRSVNCIVDTGADYTLLPREFLVRLGIEPLRREEFGLANGTSIQRDMGRAFIRFAKRGEYSPVIFGEKGDTSLLGVVTLETLGLGIDPLRRELYPLVLKM